MVKRHYYFIRHAAKNGSDHFHPGRFDRDMIRELDEPLSKKGRFQAAELGGFLKNLKIEKVVSSRRRRAVETATIISRQTGLAYDGQYDLLEEINLGSCPVEANLILRIFMSEFWPDMMRKRLNRGMTTALAAYYYLQWHRGRTLGGETAPEIYCRISEMLSVLDSLRERRIAVVGHAGWISFMALKILGESQFNIIRLSRVSNCSLTRIDSYGEGIYEIGFFARSHRNFTGSGIWNDNPADVAVRPAHRRIRD